MRAMVLEEMGKPLQLREQPIPVAGAGELLIKVHACGVCRTDLHIIDDELPLPHLPLILGHQIVGTVEAVGSGISPEHIGSRVGVPWLGGCCQQCEYCNSGRENLCDVPTFTGYSRQGGFAEYCTADFSFALPLPASYDDLHVAPLLCAGLIGFRAYRLLLPAETIGLYGIGSAAHLLIQMATALGKRIFAFTRPGDHESQDFARSLGAVWAGDSDQLPSELLDGALIFAPVGELYPQALKAVKKGGKVISAGIHMSDIPAFPYHLLWGERSLSSVANLTRQDGRDFLTLVAQHPLNVAIHTFPLEEANQALAALRSGKLPGSIVLQVNRL